MYTIKPYSFRKAELLNVRIKPSSRKFKKIDVYNLHDKYICSIGDTRYKDYPTYLQETNHSYANHRRELYRRRHRNDNIAGTAGYYALNILW
jgi:hypothetical protein